MSPRRPFAVVLAFALFTGIAHSQQQPPRPPDPGAPIPGRVHLQLDRSVWIENFVIDPKGRGLERLDARSAVATLLNTLNVERLWRNEHPYPALSLPTAPSLFELQLSDDPLR